MIETTYGDIQNKIKNENKPSQINRYLRTDIEFLSTSGQLPNKSLKTFDTPFIVHSRKTKSFAQYFADHNIEFPLLEFSDDNSNDYFLRFISNNFSNDKAHKFFINEMHFKRVPCFIDLDLENFEKTKELLTEKIAKYLIRILQKSPKGHIFKARDIARDVFHKNMFDIVGNEKKKCIINAIDLYLNQLLNSKNIKELKSKYFIKLNNSKKEYEVILDDRNREIEIKRIIKKIHDITQSEILQKLPFQLSLFDDLDEEILTDMN